MITIEQEYYAFIQLEPFHLVASFKFGNHKSNVKSVESRVHEISYGFGDPSEKNVSPH